MTQLVIENEAQLWKLIEPRLVGHWRRIEVVYPVGFPDVFGFYKGETHYIELKIGRPALKKFRPKQVEFLQNAERRGIPAWSCFGYKGRALFFKSTRVDAEAACPFVRGRE